VRALLEYYGETLFCVLHPARYIDETETVEFGEVHVFAGPQFVITAATAKRPNWPPSAAAWRRALICCAAAERELAEALEHQSELLALAGTADMRAVLARIAHGHPMRASRSMSMCTACAPPSPRWRRRLAAWTRWSSPAGVGERSAPVRRHERTSRSRGRYAPWWRLGEVPRGEHPRGERHGSR
jgi:hypothetical protein